MSNDKLFVLILGIGLIAFVYWFFLGKKGKKMVATNNEIDIVVSGGYSPNSISVKKGHTTIINFLRKDASSCLEEVIIPEYSIRQFLPLNKKTTITFTPNKVGKFNFTCGMNMFHGSIEVVEND